jgi:CBS domain-containing protein
MKTPKVRDVMTTNVVAVRERAGYKEIVEALVGFGVSALPVLDADNRVIGVVSEADLLPKTQFAGDDTQAPLFERRRRRTARAKAAGDTAAELMTTPAVTVGPDVTVARAARLMESEQVKRLPVVGDQCRLMGIVARSDLLRTYLRPDEAIQADVTGEVLLATCGIEASTVEVYVVDGIVTLRGRVERHSSAQAAVKLTRLVTGVVDVVDELAYEYDDTGALPEPQVFGPAL